jgi:hypothetical protein
MSVLHSKLVRCRRDGFARVSVGSNPQQPTISRTPRHVGGDRPSADGHVELLSSSGRVPLATDAIRATGLRSPSRCSGRDCSRRSTALVGRCRWCRATYFGFGIFAGKVLFGCATEEDLHPKADGLSRDEVLLVGLVPVAVAVALRWRGDMLIEQSTRTRGHRRTAARTTDRTYLSGGGSDPDIG